MRHTTTCIRAAAGLCLGLGLTFALVPGCNSGGKPAAAKPPTTEPSSSKPATPETPEWAKGSQVDLQGVIDGMPKSAKNSRPAADPPAESPVVGPDPATVVSKGEDGSVVSVSVDPPHRPGDVRTLNNKGDGVPDAPPKTLEQRIDESTVSLIDLITQQSMSGDMSWRNYIALAALDAIHPGAVPRVITPSQQDGGPLAEDDRQAVESLREFFAGLATIPPDVGPDARADRMAELSDKLLESRPMRIRTSSMCSRVTGYGQFVPLPSTRFQQGKPIRAIVYTEVTRFGHRALSDGNRPRNASPSDRWSVELSQAIQVFHDADGVLAWSRPAETVIETSRNKRKDFFLVHDITLPPTLTIGAYKLKVIMKDRVTGHEDQTTISFEIVADATLASEGSRD